MKKLEPFHIVFFILAVLLLLLPIVVFTPATGWNIGGFKLQFLTYEELFNPVKQEKIDISSLVSKVDTTAISSVKEPTELSKKAGKVVAPSIGTYSTESATEIYLSESGRKNLHQFFNKMASASVEKNKIHILHYGDSQIEGDRMTGYIRQRIQSQFGGKGPGMIPATNVYNTFAFTQTYSANFKRYTCFGGSKLRNKKYGVMGSAARFTPEMDSAAMQNELSQKEAWIEISPGKSSYANAKEYNSVKMFYTSCYKTCYVDTYQNGTLLQRDSLIQDGKSHALDFHFSKTPGTLKFVFTAAVSPTITGFALEGDYGVQVSNIGMRGSSGTIFGAMDQGVLAKMYSELNTELVIMQFGGNSVPYFKDSSSVRNYASNFKGQLQTLRRLRPSAAILVIGPSDMSKLSNGQFVSYPLLPYCVEQMKKVTLETGGGYWDLFGAMGGLNSMPSWVEKGLAGRDYIHFSNKGTSIAAELFFEAFAAQYVQWQEGIKTQK